MSCSDMTSVKNSLFIYKRIGSAVKEMVLLQDSYHVITADQERERVAHDMDSLFCTDRDLPEGAERLSSLDVS